MHNQSEYNTGFTLIELITTISGILVGIAIPSFTETITSNRLIANVND